MFWHGVNVFTINAFDIPWIKLHVPETQIEVDNTTPERAWIPESSARFMGAQAYFDNYSILNSSGCTKKIAGNRKGVPYT